MGRHVSGDTTYVMFADGTVEAQTPDGALHFASLDELRAYADEREAGVHGPDRGSKPVAFSANVCSIATSANWSKRPDAPPWPAPIFVWSSIGPPPVMVARSRATHFAGSQ